MSVTADRVQLAQDIGDTNTTTSVNSTRSKETVDRLSHKLVNIEIAKKTMQRASVVLTEAIFAHDEETARRTADEKNLEAARVNQTAESHRHTLLIVAKNHELDAENTRLNEERDTLRLAERTAREATQEQNRKSSVAEKKRLSSAHHLKEAHEAFATRPSNNMSLFSPQRFEELQRENQLLCGQHAVLGQASDSSSPPSTSHQQQRMSAHSNNSNNSSMLSPGAKASTGKLSFVPINTSNNNNNNKNNNNNSSSSSISKSNNNNNSFQHLPQHAQSRNSNNDKSEARPTATPSALEAKVQFGTCLVPPRQTATPVASSSTATNSSTDLQVRSAPLSIPNSSSRPLKSSAEVAPPASANVDDHESSPEPQQPRANQRPPGRDDNNTLPHPVVKSTAPQRPSGKGSGLDSPNL